MEKFHHLELFETFRLPTLRACNLSKAYKTAFSRSLKLQSCRILPWAAWITVAKYRKWKERPIFLNLGKTDDLLCNMLLNRMYRLSWNVQKYLLFELDKAGVKPGLYCTQLWFGRRQWTLVRNIFLPRITFCTGTDLWSISSTTLTANGFSFFFVWNFFFS